MEELILNAINSLITKYNELVANSKTINELEQTILPVNENNSVSMYDEANSKTAAKG